MTDMFKHFAGRIQKGIRLAPFTTFKIGGPAEFFLQVDTEDELVQAIEVAHDLKMPFFLLGGGSNLVVSDEGVKGLVIRNNANNCKLIDKDKFTIKVSSGWSLSKIVDIAAENGMAGMEPLAGIPGTIGGAVFGNAGAYGKAIGDMLVSAEILTHDGKICKVGKNFFEFAYRHSVLKEIPAVLLNATFQLEPGNTAEIKEKINDILEKRRAKHPPETVGSAGSFFKNLPPKPGETQRQPAGAVLEQVGAKNMSYGGASVYSKHANFIVNYGSATANDVRELARMLKEKVFETFGIQLSEEVIYVGG